MKGLLIGKGSTLAMRNLFSLESKQMLVSGHMFVDMFKAEMRHEARAPANRLVMCIICKLGS